MQPTRTSVLQGREHVRTTAVMPSRSAQAAREATYLHHLCPNFGFNSPMTRMGFLGFRI